MNYVLLIHSAESRFAGATPSEREARTKAYMDYTRAIAATGRAGDGAGLEPTHTATHVRIREGKQVVQDGPFAETREQLGGYYTFDASSEEEALEWASKIPDAAVGTIEVRPVRNAVTAPTPPDKDGKKEYLLVIYEPEARWASLGEEEAKAIFARYNDFSTSLKQTGRFVAGGQLDGTTKAKSVSVKAGERVVRDGPFAETREQLGGYYRVLARDLDEAIALAAKIPAAETGTIEVRPLMSMKATG